MSPRSQTAGGKKKAGEPVAIIQVRDDGGFSQGFVGRVGERWQIQDTFFMRNQQIVHCLNEGYKDGWSLTIKGKDCKMSRLVVEDQKFIIKFLFFYLSNIFQTCLSAISTATSLINYLAFFFSPGLQPGLPNWALCFILVFLRSISFLEMNMIY